MGGLLDLTTWLGAMDLAELRLVAEVSRGGRLRPGATATLLRSYGLPESWAAPLAQAGAEGWTSAQLAQIVKAVLAEREKAEKSRVSVVCTRPGAKGPDVVDTSVAVRRLFSQAEREVLIAGFRITEREMLEPLRRRFGRELSVSLFLDIDPEHDALGRKVPPVPDVDLWPGLWWQQFMEEIWPDGLEPPRAYYAPSTLRPDESGEWRSMHVKSVIVDRRWWFVTSANFTARGHRRNLEMGALIEDPLKAAEAWAAFQELQGVGVFADCIPAMVKRR